MRTEGSGGTTVEANRCMCVCMYVCIYVYIYIYIHIIHIYVCVCVCIYTHTHTYIYMHIFSEITADYECVPAQHVLRLTDTHMSELVYGHCPTVRRDVGRPKLRRRDKNPRVPKMYLTLLLLLQMMMMTVRRPARVSAHIWSVTLLNIYWDYKYLDQAFRNRHRTRFILSNAVAAVRVMAYEIIE